MQPQSHLKTNTETEAVRALGFVSQQARLARQDAYRWKWILLGLHNALQALMVLALAHGSALRVLKDQIARKWLAAYRSGGPYPEEKLDLFLSLFKKIQGNDMLFYVQSRRFEPTSSHVKKLNSLRNRFIHFLPGTWLIELAGLPCISLDCLAVGHFLAWESGNISWDTIPQATVKKAFREARRSLASLANGGDDQVRPCG